MRIISGIYRGKKLISPDSANVRPTSDRAREAVFNILYSKLGRPLAEIRLADIFTGSGAFALEAVSRGVKEALLVDLDTRQAARNIALFPKEKDRIRLIKADALNLPAAPVPCNLVFMDAPYNKGLSEKALVELHNKKWLTEDALLVVEVEKNETLTLPPPFERIDERVYGLAKVIFLRLKNS